MPRRFLQVLVTFLALISLMSAQGKPEVPSIVVSPAQARAGAPIVLTGVGMTPNRTVLSHLIRPDGTEYNPLRFRTNQKGEFSHKIDTVMLDSGMFEVWVMDEASNVASNHVHFTVTP